MAFLGRQGQQFLIRATACVVLALASWSAFAEDDVELSGILINETRTHVGHDFYTDFTTAWANYDPEGQYTLAIVERPSVMTASQITIKFGGRPLFQRFISTRAEENRKVAQLAAAMVSHQVGAMSSDVQSVMAALFPDPDMAPDEMRLY